MPKAFLIKKYHKRHALYKNNSLQSSSNECDRKDTLATDSSGVEHPSDFPQHTRPNKNCGAVETRRRLFDLSGCTQDKTSPLRAYSYDVTPGYHSDLVSKPPEDYKTSQSENVTSISPIRAVTVTVVGGLGSLSTKDRDDVDTFDTVSRQSSRISSAINNTSFVTPNNNFSSPRFTDTRLISPFASDVSQISPIVSDGFLMSPCVSDMSMTSPSASDTSPSGSDSSASSCGGKPPITQFNFPVTPWTVLSPRNVLPVHRHHVPIGHYSPNLIPVPVSGYSPRVLLPHVRLPIPIVSPTQDPGIEFINNGYGIKNPILKKTSTNSNTTFEKADTCSDDRFPCKICGKEFTLQRLLNRHMKCHSEVKRFLCMVCLKGFNDAFDLKRHTRTHTGVRPYQCSQCKKAFTQRCSLESHCQKVHEMKLSFGYKERRSKLYVCEEDGHATADPAEHYLHLKNLHPTSPVLLKFYDKRQFKFKEKDISTLVFGSKGNLPVSSNN
ncbi:early growth response protein 1-B-like [Gigantopelta aegis]|uniref:early growth response protein 1-B-like n=1 Tax=Gigantopelta aegis TaxID=1735272 RepID=UPI001B88C692|nr:early growth response protein 1-B-like [Gigantopelta aegis]